MTNLHESITLYLLLAFCHVDKCNMCFCVGPALLIIELTLLMLVLVGQSRQTTFESSSFFFKWPSYQSHSFIRVYNTLLEAFGLCVHIYKFTFSAFFFFFWLWETIFTVMNSVYNVHILKNIKNGSHDTIYTFKYYFATVFSVFSFQFSATISSI